MAKTAVVPKADPAKVVYPSSFGSHASMVQEELSKGLPEGVVICKDDDGLYATTRVQLDSGMADGNRWASPEFRKKFLDQVNAQRVKEPDPVEAPVTVLESPVAV